MRFQSFKVAAAALVTVICASQLAVAGFTPGTTNDISFRDRSQAVDSTGAATSALVPGTRFYGMFTSDSILPAGAITSPEVTGIYDLTVEFIVARTADAVSGVAAGEIFAAGGANLGKLATYSGSALAMYRPTNTTGAEGILGSGAAITLADGSIFAGASLPAFSAFAIYEGGPVNVLPTAVPPGPGLDGFATQAAELTAASDGTALGAFGFSSFALTTDWGAAGNGYWFSTATYVGGTVSPGASFFYGLNGIAGSGSMVDSPYGLTPLFNPTLDVDPFVGSATALDALTGSTVRANFAGTADTPPGGTPPSPPFSLNQYDFTGKGITALNTGGAFPLRSEDPAFVHPNTPEPGSMILALLGAGCAIPLVRRHRKNREQAA